METENSNILSRNPSGGFSLHSTDTQHSLLVAKVGSLNLTKPEPCQCNPCECDDVTFDEDEDKTLQENNVCPCPEPCQCDVANFHNSDTNGYNSRLNFSKMELTPCPCGVDNCTCELNPSILQMQSSIRNCLMEIGSKIVNNDCGCQPICECDLTNVTLQRECECGPSCDCEVPSEGSEIDYSELQVRNDITEPIPIDHAKLFYDKLTTNLQYLKKQRCYETFGKPTRYKLTKNLIRELLVDEGEKISCYLPGNELYPCLLRQRIDDKDVCNVSQILIDNRSISSLNLAYNNIGDHGLKKLATVLKDCGNISHVNLMHNNFTAKGLLYLVKALQRRAPLQTLRLTGVKFGDAGMAALTCLILSGRSPLDLDIGECDLTVEGFQTICTAFHSLDHDISYPNFLLTRKLPMHLGTLKDMKYEYNAELGHLSRMGEKVTAHRYTTTSNKNKKDPSQNWSASQNSKHSHGHNANDECDDDIPIIFQEFSATVLQGLFDIRHKLSATEIPQKVKQVPGSVVPSQTGTELINSKLTTNLMEHSAQVVAKSQQIIEELNALGPLDDYINEYKAAANKVLDESEYYAIPIVSPSYYKLDADQEEHLLSEFAHEIDNPERYSKSDDAKTKMRIYHGQVIDFGQSVLKQAVDEGEHIIDEFTANEAARFATQDLIKSAADTVAAADPITEKSDIIQLLLMTLVDLVRLNQQDFNNKDFSVAECTEMMEMAMKQLEQFLMPAIPEQCSVIQERDIKTFVRSFVETASGTFIHLLKNDNVCKVLAQDASIACRANQLRVSKNEVEAETKQHPNNNEIDGVMTDEQIHYIATQFLNGAIDEAARLISTGDPFGFRVHNVLEPQKRKEQCMEHAKEIFDTEANIYNTVENLMELSGQLAESIKTDAKEVQKAEGHYKTAASNFIESIFEDVRMSVGQYLGNRDKSELDEETDKEGVEKLEFRYVSRPTKLVLNRPFFRHYEELMGRKLGDYMAGNRSIKALHIQKWGLGEDGMIGLMDGLLKNCTLRILDLGCNQLGADGMKPLGIYLGTNKNLKHVILNHNVLKDPGLTNLIAHITESNIVSLNIAHNDITWVGLDPLLTILPETKIEALYLWGNAFGVGTWNLFKNLLETKIIYSDTLLQHVDETTFSIVKDSQLRETNQYYDVRPMMEEGLHVPPYMTDAVYSVKYVEEDNELIC